MSFISIPNFGLPRLSLPNLALPSILSDFIEILISYGFLIGNAGGNTGNNEFSSDNKNSVKVIKSTNIDSSLKMLFGQNFTIEDISKLLRRHGLTNDNINGLKTENFFTYNLLSLIQSQSKINTDSMGRTSLVSTYDISFLQKISHRKENIMSWVRGVVNNDIFSTSFLSQIQYLENIVLSHLGYTDRLFVFNEDNLSKIRSFKKFNIDSSGIQIYSIFADSPFIFDNLRRVLVSKNSNFDSSKNVEVADKFGISNLLFMTGISQANIGSLGKISKLGNFQLSNIKEVLDKNIGCIDSDLGINLVRRFCYDDQYIISIGQKLSFYNTKPQLSNINLHISNLDKINKQNTIPIFNIFGLISAKIFVFDNQGIQTYSLFINSPLSIDNLSTTHNLSSFPLSKMCIIHRENIFLTGSKSIFAANSNFALTHFSSVSQIIEIIIDYTKTLYLAKNFSLCWGGKLVAFNIITNHPFMFDWWLRPSEYDWWWTLDERRLNWIISNRMVDWIILNRNTIWGIVDDDSDSYNKTKETLWTVLDIRRLQWGVSNKNKIWTISAKNTDWTIINEEDIYNDDEENNEWKIQPKSFGWTLGDRK